MLEKQHRIARLFFLFLTLTSTLANHTLHGEVIEEPTSEKLASSKDSNKFRMQIGGLGINLRRDSVSQTGIGGQGVFLIGLSKKWQVGIGMQQALSISPLTMLYTSLDLRLIYAITGSFVTEKQNVSLNEKDVAVTTDKNLGGLRIQGIVSENFLKFIEPINSSYVGAGIGLGLQYELPSDAGHNWFIGARFDLIPNAGSLIRSLQGNLGIAFWL